MQQTLWGDERPQPAKKSTTSGGIASSVILTAQDCLIYGHSWQPIGMSGEKKCLACGIIGYCPGCTTTPPRNAQPFSCTRHTQQTEGRVRP
jgi:hypothetical protein